MPIQVAQEHQQKQEKSRVYPWRGTTFGDFIMGTFKVIFLNLIFIPLFCINLVKLTVSFFFTWILGKAVILILLKLITYPFPQLDEPIGRLLDLCSQWFFNMGVGQEMTLFPGGAVEIGIILFLSVLGAFAMTASQPRLF
ncbi:hypothetical protein SUT380_21110 (plasmid) [Streptococcus parasuis]|nr:hypothetical protein SUT380_21110 [Streptococcus parasuis]